MGMTVRLTSGLCCRLLAVALLVGAAAAPAQDRFIVMASTTSTEQSGLFGHLLPIFKQATGIDVRVVALGTGQALDSARRGDADVVLVHDTVAEEKFVAEGFALRRLPVMHNDFILIGPAADPLQTRGNRISSALVKLAQASAGGIFISRGDKSGTHAAELRYWKNAGVDNPKFANYKACGCGMGPALNIGSSSPVRTFRSSCGPALNIASSTGAYVLADRGTWLSFKNRGDLKVLVEGDKSLFNPYGVMVVAAARHPHAKQALAQQFADWITSAPGQAAIASYKVGGEQLFFPSAN